MSKIPLEIIATADRIVNTTTGIFGDGDARDRLTKRIAAEIYNEHAERVKLADLLHEKDAAMGVLFQRLADNNIDVSDLIP